MAKFLANLPRISAYCAILNALYFCLRRDGQWMLAVRFAQNGADREDMTGWMPDLYGKQCVDLNVEPIALSFRLHSVANP